MTTEGLVVTEDDVVPTVAASVGRARALRMALPAEPLAAVVDAVRRGAPLGQAATTRAVDAAALAQVEPVLELERTTQTMLLRTSDVAEGMRAFSEKRAPRFTGD